MRKEKFITGEIYHILNRGVDKRVIFSDNEDYFRFIHDMYEFNDKNPAINIYYRQSYDFGNRKNHNQERDLIVDIFAFTLMSNHFHFLVRQRQDNGIQMFMRKLGAGYANYFNQKNQRSGTLFESRFKAILVKTHQYLTHLPYYIHLNSLDIFAPEWRKREVHDYRKIMRFLENYRWSSLPDYLGVKNFPSVINSSFLTELTGQPPQFKQSLIAWLKDFDLSRIDEIILE